MLKTYFFKRLLNRWSDFHQNRVKSSSDCADKKYAFRVDRRNHFRTVPLQILVMVPK